MRASPSLAVLCAALFALPARALVIEVRAGQQKCLQEVLAKHDLVKGAFKVEAREGATDNERTGLDFRVRFWVLAGWMGAAAAFRPLARALQPLSTLRSASRGAAAS